MKSRNGNIIFTSAGSKLVLLSALRESIKTSFPEYYIFAGDSYSMARTKLLDKDSLLTPRWIQLTDDDLLSFFQRSKIDIIIPTSDSDHEFFATKRSFLSKYEIFTMTSSIKSIKTCLDKLEFYSALKNKFPVIDTSEDLDNLEVDRFVVKNRFGSGSKGLMLDVTREQAKNFSSLLSFPIFQPFIEGTEFSVDIYLSKSSKPLGAIVRERFEIRDGESKVSIISNARNDLLELACSIAVYLKLEGPVNIQIIDSGGELYVVECNARIGGGASASIKSGLQIMNWFIAECNGLIPELEFPFIAIGDKDLYVRFEEEKLIAHRN